MWCLIYPYTTRTPQTYVLHNASKPGARMTNKWTAVVLQLRSALEWSGTSSISVLAYLHEFSSIVQRLPFIWNSVWSSWVRKNGLMCNIRQWKKKSINLLQKRNASPRPSTVQIDLQSPTPVIFKHMLPSTQENLCHEIPGVYTPRLSGKNQQRTLRIPTSIIYRLTTVFRKSDFPLRRELQNGKIHSRVIVSNPVKAPRIHNPTNETRLVMVHSWVNV